MILVCCSSVQLLSRVWLFVTPWTAACQASLSITSPQSCSNSCPLSWWCHPTVSSSVIPFSCLQSFPASGSFSMNQLFTSGGQSIGASASASVLPMNIQYWFPLGLTDLISLQSKGLSRVFSNTTVQKHPFFSVQPSFWPSSHICTGLLENLFSTVKFFHMLLEQTSRIFSSCNTEILYHETVILTPPSPHPSFSFFLLNSVLFCSQEVKAM